MPETQISNINIRLKLIHQFGEELHKQLAQTESPIVEELKSISGSAKAQNQWFLWTEIERSFRGISTWFTPESLATLRAEIEQNLDGEKAPYDRVGIICAGNIPFVGLHDVLMVYACGLEPVVKLSSQDRVCMMWFFNLFETITGSKMATLVERMDNFDAVIATGSGNTARYFETYFGKYPHIIRKNRTSVAILDDTTSDSDLKNLADDVFNYFGLGCRNVSHLFLPQGFSLDRLFEAFFERGEYLMQHNKYMNNYDYHRAIYLLEKIPFLENNFTILKEDPALFSPVGTTHYSFYTKKEEVLERIAQEEHTIQCVAGKDHIPFGQTQAPGILDFADGVNTVEFLLKDKECE